MKRHTFSALGLTAALALAACSPPPEDQTAKNDVEAPAPVEQAPPPPVEAPKPVEAPAPAPERAPPPVAARPKPRPAPPPVAVAPPPPPPPPRCTDCGVVSSIEPIKTRGEGTGAGAVVGGVLGGVIGHQFGGGKGKDVATAVGAIGGAVAGHQVERTVRSTTTYRVTVSMETGGSQQITLDQPGGLTVGERVHVNGNTISPRTD